MRSKALRTIDCLQNSTQKSKFKLNANQKLPPQTNHLQIIQ